MHNTCMNGKYHLKLKETTYAFQLDIVLGYSVCVRNYIFVLYYCEIHHKHMRYNPINGYHRINVTDFSCVGTVDVL